MTHPILSRGRLLAAAAAAALVCALPAQAADSHFSFTGATTDGVFAANDFLGHFAYDAAALTGIDLETVALSSFSMSFRGQSYTLATADVPAMAVFWAGSFVGVDYADVDSTDSVLRPNVVLTAGMDAFADQAFFAYETAAGTGGFGSYSVSAVPEPGSYAMLLAGLGAVGFMARRRRA